MLAFFNNLLGFRREAMHHRPCLANAVSYAFLVFSPTRSHKNSFRILHCTCKIQIENDFRFNCNFGKFSVTSFLIMLIGSSLTLANSDITFQGRTRHENDDILHGFVFHCCCSSVSLKRLSRSTIDQKMIILATLFALQ